MPNFVAVTPAKGAFALLGVPAMIAEGNRIIAENSIKDPAEQIAAGLIKTVESAYGSRPSANPVKVTADDLSHITAAANGATRFLFDVETTAFTLGYFPTDWSHYRVMYGAKARLIDLKSKQVVADGLCKRIPETNANAPTYDELLQNGAKRLKEELNAAAEECIRTLKAEMLAT